MSGKKDKAVVAEVDAMVTAIGPQLGTPGTERRDDVLVTGPWLAGVSGVVAALSDRLPEADIHRVDGSGRPARRRRPWCSSSRPPPR